MASYLHDGTEFDLGRDYMDVTGIVWMWSTMRDATGAPLMGSRTSYGRVDGNEPLVSLPDLYLWHGPLLPVPAPVTADERRRVLLQGAT